MNSQLSRYNHLAITRTRSWGFIALGCFAAVTIQSRSATFVSGSVSGTWAKSGSPYVVTGNLAVPGGQTLTIQPGVTVIIGQGLKVDVLGSISAIGTAAERITIRGANATLYWDTISVSYGIGASSFTNCTISDATNALYLSINGSLAGSVSMNTQILNCVFTNCQGSCISGLAHGTAGGIPYGGIFVYNPILSPKIQNCRFVTSGNGCVFVADGTRYSNYGAFDGSGAVNPLIANCVFDGITGSAISYSVGVYPATSHPNVFSNVFTQCATALQRPASGSWFDDQVAYNCFFNNTTNFVGYPAGVYGTVGGTNDRGSGCDLAYNIFEDPRFADTVTYALANNSPCIDAGNPAGAYLDTNLPPSEGTTVNDMGIYGGPYAGNWLTDAYNGSGTYMLTAKQYVGVTIIPSGAGRYRLDSATDLNGPWTQVTNVDLLSTPWTWIDYDSPTTPKRFFRATRLP